MKDNRCLNLFRQSIFVLIICISAFNAQTNAAFAADDDGKKPMPHIVGGAYKSYGYLGFGHSGYTEFEEREGDDYGMREFIIPARANDSIKLHAAYKPNLVSEGGKLDLGEAIAQFETRTDQYWVDAYVQDLGASKYWQSAQAHVGVFTQDGCEADIHVIYTLSNKTVIAEIYGGPARNVHCTYSDLLPNGRSADMDYCKIKFECVRKYFSTPENRATLQSPHLKKVRELRVE